MTRGRRLAQQLYTTASAGLQVQQTNTQAQTIAKQYGINPQDLQNIDAGSMEAHARVLQRLNRVEAGTQNVQQQQVQREQFDSGVGASAGSAAEQLIARLGNPQQVASPQDMAAWNAYMNQTLRK